MAFDLSALKRPVMQVEIPDPANRIKSMAALRSQLIQDQGRGLQNQVTQAGIQSNQQKQARDDEFRRVLSETGGDIEKAAPRLYAIDPEAADTLVKTHAQIQNWISENDARKNPKPPGPSVLSEGAMLVDPTGKTLATNAKPEPYHAPTVIGEGSSAIDATGKVVYSNPKPRDPKRITVNPGDTVIDESGAVIYQSTKPETAKNPIVVGQGDILVDPTGKQLFANPKPEVAQPPMTVGPGASLVDRSGKVLYNNPKPETEKTEAGSYIPLTDPQGRVIGAWNPKSATFQPIPEEAEGARKNALPAGTNTQLRDFENSVRKIKELGTAYKPEFVGPYQGRYEASKASGVLSYFPFFQTAEGYPKFAALNADLKNAIIKLITGAQMGREEAQRILQQVPVETDKEDIWAGKYDETLKNAEFLLSVIQKQTGTAEAAPAPSGDRREQHSPSTDQYRYTTDGGKTWHSGRLPK